MDSGRAPRISKEVWDAKKETICSLYRGSTLKEAMRVLAEEHDFHPSRRQLVYKLIIWGERKYGADRKQQTPSPEGSVDIGLRGSPPNWPDSFDGPGPESFGMVGLPHNSSPYPQNEQPPPSHELLSPGKYDILEDVSHYHFSGDSGAWNRPGNAEWSETDFVLSQPQNRSNHAAPDSDWQRKKRAADFLFALSDDWPAFKIYFDLYQCCKRTPSTSDLHQRLCLLYACARSAEHMNHTVLARNLVQPHLQNWTGEAERLVWRMLDSYICDRSDSPESSNGVAFRDSIEQEALRSVLENQNESANMPTHFSIIDMVTFLLLEHHLSRITSSKQSTSTDSYKTRLNGPTIYTKDILQKYVQQQPLGKCLNSGYAALASDPLKGCLDWIQHQLDNDPEVPAAIRNIPCDTDTVNWKRYIKLFCCLWHCWQQPSGPDAQPPHWTLNAESQLGLSPTELLVTVSWMILDASHNEISVNGKQIGRPDIAGGTSNDEDDRSLIMCADHGAKSLASWSLEKLWIEFLRKFTFMNHPDGPSSRENTFKAAAIIPIRAYLQSILHIDIPAPEKGDDSLRFPFEMNLQSDTSVGQNNHFTQPLNLDPAFGEPSSMPSHSDMTDFSRMNHVPEDFDYSVFFAENNISQGLGNLSVANIAERL